MKKKKIGIFTGYFLPHMGGVERYVDKLSASLQKRGYDIFIVTANDSDRKNYEKNNHYSVYRLPVLNIFKKRYPIPRFNGEYKELIRSIEKEEIDYFIVNTRFYLTSLIGAKLGERLHKPVMLIEHGTAHFTVGSSVLDLFGRLYEHVLTGHIKKYVDTFYGVSKNSTIWMRHFSIEADGVLYNAIDPADKPLVKDLYSEAYPKNEIIITYAGRLIKQKGIVNLLEAFRQLDKSNKNVKIRLFVAGDGELLEMIKSKYTDKNIDILGKLDFDHIMALYKRTDIFVYPSLYPEGLPTAILEAGLMECAIIATPRGGTEEVIVDSEHGTIVDGSVESLYEAMKVLISDGDMRKKQAQKVMSRIQTYFNWDSVAKSVDSEIKGFDRKKL